MSFTTDIKKEIVSRKSSDTKTRAQKNAAFSAFVRTSGTIGVKDGKPIFFLVSESENVAEYFMRIFSETFGVDLSITHATMDKFSGRGKLLLQCPETEQERVLKEIGIVDENGFIVEGISNAVIEGEEEQTSYIRGAFLGGGSCSLPSENVKSSYHLEIVFTDERTANDFCEMLLELELLFKYRKRKEKHVVYIKSKEMISDFLSVIGVEHSLKKFSAFLDKRDESNHHNRALNCKAGNADKAAKAALKQLAAIDALEKSGVLQDMSEDIQDLAKARREQKDMSMQELADYLKISKSCLNHRMRRLIETAEKTEET